MSTPALAIVTPSYRNDFEMATALCRSIDAHVQADFEHLLIVPRRDLALFAPLAGPRRRVVSEQDLLAPYGLRPLPLPTRIRIPGLFERRFRQQWWCRGVGRISGWVTQQLIKLSACDLTRADILMFIDSDVALIRPLQLDAVLKQGQVLLHQAPLPPQSGEHLRWCLAARDLLGVKREAPPRWDYIGNLITWRAGNIRRLQARITEVKGESWQRAIARRRDFSEYILYGVYCDEVLGLEASGHRAETSRLTHSVWTPDSLPTEEAFCRGLKPEHVAVHLQSTLPIDARVRHGLVVAAQARQARDD